MNGEKRGSSEFATASLVLGILQFVRVFNVEKALLAIIFGIIALKWLSANPELGGKNRAVAGLVLGVIGVIVTIVMTIVFWPQMQAMMERMGTVSPQK
jgi:hypothetical protein